MAPSNLQGLNIVHPPQELSDSQDVLDLLAYPELSAQLDLWTNLTFDSDETYAHRHGVRDVPPLTTSMAQLLSHSQESPLTPVKGATSNPLTTAEDKRRRNTAASARFRLKKKEREAALEGRAKELETKVAELERECEGLRRENGWLRGLVVGVTGAAQGSNTSQGLTAGSSPPVTIPRTKRRRVENVESEGI